MPLFVKSFHWEQSSTSLFVNVPLKGAKKSNVSVLQSEDYVKVSFPPYLFEAALAHKIDPSQTFIRIADGFINIRLAKTEPEAWENLSRSPLDDAAEEKSLMLKLRSEAVDFSIKSHEEQKQAKREDKTKKDRFSVQQQIKLEQDERKRIEDYKNSEKERAVKEIVEFQQKASKEEDLESSELQNQVDHYQELENKLAQIDSDEDELEILQQNTKSIREEEQRQLDETNREQQTNQRVEVPPKLERSEKIFDDQEVSKVAIRGCGNIGIKFTPRVFPTPARESRKPEEDEWLAKQASARERANVDTSELTEAEKDPILLKEKGNKFFQQGNMQGAINVFTHAISLFPKMPELYSNRAACHLKLRNFFKSLEDSSRALELLTPAVEANARDRLKAHMRRGLAFCELECYAEGLIEYEAALKIEPSNHQLKDDCNKLRQYVQGSYKGHLNESPAHYSDSESEEEEEEENEGEDAENIDPSAEKRITELDESSDKPESILSRRLTAVRTDDDGDDSDDSPE